MPGDDDKEGGGAALPELPSLSVGFWDAFASGRTWSEPVLAVLSCSPVGSDHQLILATDGSLRNENKLRKPSARSPEPQASAQQVEEPHATEEAEPQDRVYQHGRLLVQKKTISFRPELLVNRLVSLLVYARCAIKGRLTPVVTDLQLFPGHWTRPKAAFVSHPLYASDTSSAKRTGTASGAGKLDDLAADEASPHSLSKRSRKGIEDVPGGTRLCSFAGTSNAARSPVYSRSRGGPVAKVQRGVRTALADLHLYSHHWEVLARVSYKSPVHCFANAKGESSLFTVNLIDAQTTEIRATFFGRAVCLWYPRLHVGRVYTFSGGILQRANRMHNPLPQEVEIKFDATAKIEEAEDMPSIPLQRFERVKLADIPSLPPGTIVDLLAFVTEAKEPQTIVSRTKNEELVRRELTLLDSSGSSVSLTLFGAQAMQLSQTTLANIPLLAIKGARVTEYAGRACLSSTTQMQICSFLGEQSTSEGPDAGISLLPQGSGGLCGVSNDQLDTERSWWHSEGDRLAAACAAKSPAALGFQALKEIALESQRLLQDPGSTIRENRFTILLSRRSSDDSVHIVAVPARCYRACPTCKRKVQKELPSASTTSAYKCNKCRCAVTPEPRWMLSLKVADFSGTLNCVALGDQGQAIMQVVDTTAEGLSKLEAGGVDTRGRTFANILEQLSFAEFELQLTAKCDVYKEDKTVQLVRIGCAEQSMRNRTESRQ
ncbi:hypothetical protein Esti_002789 [Eimeria stiedai]